MYINLNTIMPFLESIISGIISGLIATFIYAFLKRPVIEVFEDEDEWNPEFKSHVVHVRVRNKKSFLPWISRNPAIDCMARVRFINVDNPNEVKGTFETKWARITTGLPFEMSVPGVGPVIGASPRNPPVEKRLTIYPGMSDGGKEGVQLDIAWKEKGVKHCVIADPQYFVEPKGKSKWILEEGRYYVEVVIEYAGGKSRTYRFLLTNEGTLPNDVMRHPRALSLRELNTDSGFV